MTTNNPVKLINYFFPVQEVVANADYKPEEKPLPCAKLELDVKHAIHKFPNQNEKYNVELGISLANTENENVPYHFNIQGFAIATVSDQVPEDKAEALVHRTIVYVLIGAIRERLADLTGRGPWPATNLDLFSLPDDIAAD